MSQDIELNEPLDKTLKHEELEQIVKAIIGGKYSWACFLILHFINCNPIDYIPYRTYIRLLKKNYQVGEVKPCATNYPKLALCQSWNSPSDKENGSN
jgi:hypothetical protein